MYADTMFHNIFNEESLLWGFWKMVVGSSYKPTCPDPLPHYCTWQNSKSYFGRNPPILSYPKDDLVFKQLTNNHLHDVTFPNNIIHLQKMSCHVSSVVALAAFSRSRISFWMRFCWQCPLVPCLTNSPFSIRYCLLWWTTAPWSIWNWQSARRGCVRSWNWKKNLHYMYIFSDRKKINQNE